MPLETTTFDAAEYLDTPEAIAAYLADAVEDNSPGALAQALGTVARAKGMAAIATETGLGRESLYKSLREGGDPKLSTVSKVLAAMGVRLTVEPA
ncbi:putative addiction module antidote protein [Salipiger manganoxidans]|uniref:addiction module antidote protein n=1 Tax=Salipiger marinus TaxID=555512 RepID=UPI001E5483CD|nr:addiction module antidote protein [Salipiger manganoxidans]MCD1619127.1 putative addiction module antidote protein [Salipiger manganoxidans]